MILFGSVDLGASLGGAEIDYTPTIFQVEIDQAILPVKAWKTKEEVTFTVALLQVQAATILNAFGYASSGVVTVVAGSLATATAPTVTNQGAVGAVTYSYTVVAYDSNGDGIPSPVGTTATGNAALTATNYNALAWAAVAGATGYKIQRTVGGTTQGTIANVSSSAPLTLNDTGLVATPYTPVAANPTTPNTDTMYFGGAAVLAQGAFDFAVPKNDGTNNHIRGHLNQCYSAKAIKINFHRDKATEANKVSLMALADLTQPTGRQAGYLLEEY